MNQNEPSNPEVHTQEHQPENEGQQPATQEETSTRQPQEASATDSGGASRTGINTVSCQTFINHNTMYYGNAATTRPRTGASNQPPSSPPVP